jgi:hypothetical protein
MTRDEADALAAYLERIGVRVEGIEPRRWHEGEWQVRAWCDDPPHWYAVTNAGRFREAVSNGLTPVLPRGALDCEKRAVEP